MTVSIGYEISISTSTAVATETLPMTRVSSTSYRVTNIAKSFLARDAQHVLKAGTATITDYTIDYATGYVTLATPITNAATVVTIAGNYRVLTNVAKGTKIDWKVSTNMIPSTTYDSTGFTEVVPGLISQEVSLELLTVSASFYNTYRSTNLFHLRMHLASDFDISGSFRCASDLHSGSLDDIVKYSLTFESTELW